MARYVFHHALPGAPTSGSTAYAAVHIDDDGAAAAGERVRIGDDVVLKTTSADPLLARVMSIILNDATTSSSGGGCLRVQWYFRGSELPFLQDARFAKVRRPGVDESAPAPADRRRGQSHRTTLVLPKQLWSWFNICFLWLLRECIMSEHPPA